MQPIALFYLVLLGITSYIWLTFPINNIVLGKRWLIILHSIYMSVDILLGLQWGDEGKGKVVDFLAPKYDVVARFQGGPTQDIPWFLMVRSTYCTKFRAEFSTHTSVILLVMG